MSGRVQVAALPARAATPASPQLRPIQAKLTVNPAGDRHEQEADRVADALLRGEPLPPITSLHGAGRPTAPAPASLQREAQDDRDEEEDAPLQAKAAGAAVQPAPAFAARLAGATPRGMPLPAETRAFFEPRLGRDLGQVRVHDGAEPAVLARSIGARAFTQGQHIYFASGEFSPSSAGGRRLLAHELVHTVQQAGGGAAPLQRDPPAVNPEIARVPGNRYVDAYAEVHYDLDYRATGGNLSTWLTVVYADEAEIDISINDIADRSVDQLESMAAGHLGPQGRIFPRELTRTTVPRLWAAKQDAIAVMEQYNYEFMLATLPAVLFIITLAGSPPLSTSAAPRRITRPRPPVRRIPPTAGGGTTAAPAAAAPAAAAAPGAAASSSFRLLSPRVMRYGGRDIVVVQTSRGPQAFYRRTGMGGTNAGGAQAGDWAPVDGILAGWFDKARYVSGSADDVLFRFGTEENRRASQWLGQQAIRAGDDVGEVWSLVNQFLQDLGALRTGT